MISTKKRNVFNRSHKMTASGKSTSDVNMKDSFQASGLNQSNRVRSMVFQIGTTHDQTYDTWINSKLKRHSDGMLLKRPDIDVIPDWMMGWQSHTRIRSVPDFLSGKQYGYIGKVYLAAAQIFEKLAVQKDEEQTLIHYGSPSKGQESINVSFETPRIKRQAYELAYETLKYQELLEEILLDSGFLFEQAISDDLMALVVVLLFDFQNRRFDPWCKVMGDEADSDVTTVQESLLNHKTRIAAALARCRVKNQSLTIDYVLPENVRQQEKCASKLPQTTWVNTLKSSMSEVIDELTDDGYVEVKTEEHLLSLRGKYFCRDIHCDDVILFPTDQKEHLKSLNGILAGNIVLQDKSSSLAAHSVGSLLTDDDEYDVLHTNVASGLTTAHIAILLQNKTKKKVETRTKMFSNPLSTNQFFHPHVEGIEKSENELKLQHIPTVFACGVESESHRQALNKLMENLGIKNVKLLSAKFDTIDPQDDDRFKRVKIILSSPQCSRTAVANPIDFMLNEGDKESYNVLRDLSLGQKYDNTGESGKALLDHLKTALKFPSVQACVYVTRSVLESENENVVRNVVKWHRQNCVGTQPFRVCPPTIPLTSNNITSSTTSLKENFLKLRPTPTMNGCFIAVISRELPNDEMTVKDILRRAALKGLVKPLSITDDLSFSKPVQTMPMSPSPVEDDKKSKPKLKKKQSFVKPVAVTKKTKSTPVFAEKPKPNKPAITQHKPDSSEIHKLLGIYQSRQEKDDSPRVRKSEGYFKSDEIAQVNLNLEFHSPTAMKFSSNKPNVQTSQDKIEKRHKVNSKIKSAVKVEEILEELTERESRK